MGAALLAGYGAGLFASLDDAAKTWVGTAESVRPDMSRLPYYARRLERYKAALEALSRIVRS